ncbi:EAL domain-containing protein [Oceanicella sp. SM1341]|uniref:EAL domain-containing response regulator n=1 Tax=Oceanicella sp. SM1341 TaxID=1548889 RepID=UPI000E4F0F1C|nr:EAL domain-containing response regulator [Oceanicella sp. SM1341]
MSLMLGLTVLVVDDEPFMRSLVTRLLEVMGARSVLTCEDGRAALENDIAGVDLVLCDLNMPGMDGPEFLRRLAEAGFGGSVVLMSGEDARILDTAVALARAHGLRVLGALAKPITPDALRAMLEAVPADAAGEAGPPAAPRTGTSDFTAQDLAGAISGRALEVHFQPKVRVSDGRVMGVEALARWTHRGHAVPPTAFIGCAEENGLINALTDVVFDKAVRQGARWLAAGRNIKISVNFSVLSLERLDLPEYIVDTAVAAGLDPTALVIELTESRLMSDLRRPLEVLTRLRLKGVGLAIDDFGTGYSTLEQLRRIPFTELKVDRAFVTGAAHDTAARAILESSVSLARALGLAIVAEGAETREDWDRVSALGVDMVQGYFVARPMPAEEFDAWHAV